MYKEHVSGVKALEAYTVANTHLAYVRQDEAYMRKVLDYCVHTRREWWRCYDRQLQLEAELAKYGIPSPSPYSEPFLDTPPEDPPTAELWTTKWDKTYMNKQYTTWKDLGILDEDIVKWVESQPEGAFYLCSNSYLPIPYLQHAEPATNRTPSFLASALPCQNPSNIPDTSVIRVYPNKLAKIAEMLKCCSTSEGSTSQTLENGGRMDSQSSVFTIPEELPDWFKEELEMLMMAGEEDAGSVVEIGGSLAQAVKEVLAESQKSICGTQTQ